MNIAIVAATEFEIERLKSAAVDTSHHLSFHVHGIGLMMSMFHLQKIIQTQPDFIIQCGIAGSYSKEISLGEVVVVESETLGDTGSQDHDSFLDLFDLGFINKNEFPFHDSKLFNPFVANVSEWRKVDSLSVNTGSGNQTTIDLRIKKYNPDIESMEGACLHYTCLQEGIPFIQFRGISNYVEPRNKANWKIEEGIKNSQDAVLKFIEHFPFTTI